MLQSPPLTRISSPRLKGYQGSEKVKVTELFDYHVPSAVIARRPLISISFSFNITVFRISSFLHQIYLKTFQTFRVHRGPGSPNDFCLARFPSSYHYTQLSLVQSIRVCTRLYPTSGSKALTLIMILYFSGIHGKSDTN